jgi:DNA invertase Pin-like site-specific DNA recombinase
MSGRYGVQERGISKVKRRVAIYARVSTDGQTTENQLRELRKMAEISSWHVVQEFVDHGFSGANGRDKRPAYDDMCKGIVRREFDMVMTWSVDRLGRSLQHLVSFLEELHSKSVDLYLHQQGIDTTSPAGKAMFQMLGVFAEFERSMIRERINSGLARARANGKKLGRPRILPEVERKVLALRQVDGAGQPKGIIKIAKELGLGVGTVKRIVDAHEKRVA